MHTQWLEHSRLPRLLADAAAVPVLSPVSPEAHAIRHVLIVVFFICVTIFVIVVLLIVVSLLRFRARDGDNAIPRQSFGSHRAEIGWTIPPMVIVLFLGLVAARLIVSEHAAPPDESADANSADITVIGHQWWWEIRYAGSTAVTANEIHIPVGRKLRVKVDSADVIHSFWVPQLGPKKDMIRGHPNFLWLQADRAGVYDGACSEFCGAQHAWMRFVVVAEDEQQYQTWLTHQARPAPTPTSAAAIAGRDIFFAQTCANCHAIGGTNAIANAAPDLTHFATRRDLAAGVVPNTRDNLTRWLRKPDQIKPGCKMPNFNFNDAQLDQLVAYLETLQ
ncbi:MAG: cytochrome c oxidase subunit [Phycisphaerales bacterium]|jgi:cytochrome c oxidase subunit 2|nr:cytochrome c oxidase subunit [Phycisphaerales bacterium]